MNPMLIGMLLLRYDGSVQNTNVRLSDITTLSSAQAQELANAVQNKIVYPKEAPSGFLKVKFIGGIFVEILRAFVETKGHTMETLISEAFPSLRRFHPNVPGNLNKAVTDFVLTEWRKFTPCLIADILIEISEDDTD